MHPLPRTVFSNNATDDGRQQIGVLGTEELYFTPVQPTAEEVYSTAYFALSKHVHSINPTILKDFYDWVDKRGQNINNTLTSFYAWMQKREAWSRDTFGTNYKRGPVGPAKHLRKEVDEYLAADTQKNAGEEIADMLFLIFDVATRSGFTFAEIVYQLERKLSINKTREWPKGASDEPIEHNRAKDATPVHGIDTGEPVG